MMKTKGEYLQVEPALFVDGKIIPPVQLGNTFKYLGKLYDFESKNSSAKAAIVEKLNKLLSVTTNIKVKVQMKLKIVKLYVYSQILFDLRLYNFGGTWIDANLDSIIVKHIRDWMEMPISTGVKEMISLPIGKGGLAMPLLKNVSKKCSHRCGYKRVTH
jgi:hypothetical protein